MCDYLRFLSRRARCLDLICSILRIVILKRSLEALLLLRCLVAHFHFLALEDVLLSLSNGRLAELGVWVSETNSILQIGVLLVE